MWRGSQNFALSCNVLFTQTLVSGPVLVSPRLLETKRELLLLQQFYYQPRQNSCGMGTTGTSTRCFAP